MRPSSILRGLAALTLAATAILATPAAAGASPKADPSVLAAPDISLANQRAHAQQFQSIASANGGNRRSTTSG